MSGLSRRFIQAVLATVAFLAITPASAQTAGSGPYYATPSWDLKLQCDTSATCPRFIVLTNWNNAAVLDRETGLVWDRSPSSEARSWEFHKTACMNLNKGGRKGWRLPAIQELLSLADPANADLSLPSGHPFLNVLNTRLYWSATTQIDFLSIAWVASFGGGGSAATFSKSGDNYAWCVRGAPGMTAQ